MAELKRIKVLFVSDTFFPRIDGIVRFLSEVTKRISPLFEISFLAPNLYGSEDAAKKLKRKAYLCPTSKFKIKEFPITHPNYELVRKSIENSDIVFINSIAPLGASALLHAHSVKKPVVVYIHAIDWELLAYATNFPNRAVNLLKPVIRRMYARADLLIVANRYIKKILKNNRIKGPFEIVELGVDLKKFRPSKDVREKIRKKLGISDNYVIGFHGRLSPEKNIDMLFKMLKLVKLHIPNAKLLVVGDGPEHRVLSRSKDVILTGFVSDPEKYLKAMDIYVLPSKTETSGLSLMEAMACGLPVVSSAVGSIPSYVKHRRNGILIKPADLSSSLLAKSVRTIHDNPSFTKKLKENAVETVREFYSWENTVKKLEKIFKRFASK